jgi:hypothetical protein
MSWLQRPARRSIGIFVAGMVLAVPATVLAVHQFPDVPNSNPFHQQISAIAEAGITAGFGDGNYHPADPVTRQAMAAFMHRGFGRIAHDAENVLNMTIDVGVGTFTSTDVPAKDITITVPGATNAFSPSQLVYVHGRMDITSSFNTSLEGCPCEFGAIVEDVSALTVSGTAFGTFESSGTANHTHSFTIDTVFVAPPGPRTYRLKLTLLKRDSATNAASFLISPTSSFTAMTFPFGADGTEELYP